MNIKVFLMFLKILKLISNFVISPNEKYYNFESASPFVILRQGTTKKLLKNMVSS